MKDGGASLAEPKTEEIAAKSKTKPAAKPDQVATR